jgi:competence ComEA-like helix-hairpin-helix protein
MAHRPLTRLLLTAILLLCAGATTATTKKPPTHPININTAQSADLQQVPGIGPATAKKILQTRKSYGSFKTVDDLLSIRGIGPKRLEKMRKYLSTGKSSQNPTRSPTAAKSPAPSPKATHPQSSTTPTTKPAFCTTCLKKSPTKKETKPTADDSDSDEEPESR